jgi:hypothetical protein
MVHVLPQRRPGLNPKYFHVNFVVHKVATGLVFLGVFLFSLSVSFYHFSMLTFIYVSLLPGQTVEKLEPSKKAVLFPKSGNVT